MNSILHYLWSVEKFGVTLHCLYWDSLTLIYHISSNRRRTLEAPKLVLKNSAVKIFFFDNRCCILP